MHPLTRVGVVESCATIHNRLASQREVLVRTMLAGKPPSHDTNMYRYDSATRIASDREHVAAIHNLKCGQRVCECISIGRELEPGSEPEPVPARSTSHGASNWIRSVRELKRKRQLFKSKRFSSHVHLIRIHAVMEYQYIVWHATISKLLVVGGCVQLALVLNFEISRSWVTWVES